MWYDLPPIREFAEDQRETAVRRLAVRHGQLPYAANERSVRPENFNTQIRKIQLSHFVAGTGVRSAIPLDRGLPSSGFFCPREERQVGRVPVAGHKGVKVVMIPGILLGQEDVLDGGFGIVVCSLGSSED